MARIVDRVVYGTGNPGVMFTGCGESELDEVLDHSLNRWWPEVVELITLRSQARIVLLPTGWMGFSQLLANTCGLQRLHTLEGRPMQLKS